MRDRPQQGHARARLGQIPPEVDRQPERDAKRDPTSSAPNRRGGDTTAIVSSECV
jgi:hypothetical protein